MGAYARMHACTLSVCGVCVCVVICQEVTNESCYINEEYLESTFQEGQMQAHMCTVYMESSLSENRTNYEKFMNFMY